MFLFLCFQELFILTRGQTCITTLALRNMVQPFKPGILSTSKPMADILGEITAGMDELKRLKGRVEEL